MIIEITEKAKEYILGTYKKDCVEITRPIRLKVIGGGCSGMSYKMEFGEKTDKDNFLEFGDLKVVIDLKSSIYLKGVTLDYKDGLEGKGIVFINPSAKNTCGCGESFSV